jgi:hypothetical protein
LILRVGWDQGIDHRHPQLSFIVRGLLARLASCEYRHSLRTIHPVRFLQPWHVSLDEPDFTDPNGNTLLRKGSNPCERAVDQPSRIYRHGLSRGSRSNRRGELDRCCRWRCILYSIARRTTEKITSQQILRRRGSPVNTPEVSNLTLEEYEKLTTVTVGLGCLVRVALGGEFLRTVERLIQAPPPKPEPYTPNDDIPPSSYIPLLSE